MNKNRFDAIGLGLCAWDRILLFDRYPDRNEKVEAVDGIECGGGPVPTALAVFSRLGGKAAFVGVTGDDQEGLAIRQDLKDFQVNVDHLLTRPNHRSNRATIWVDQPTGNRTVALVRGNAESLKKEELPKSLLSGTPLLLMDGRDTELCLRAAEIIHKGGGKVVLDAGSPRQNIETLLCHTDHAVVSQDFIRGTFHGHSEEEAVQMIQSMGPDSVVVTLGERGGWYAERDLLGSFASFQVPVRDTTGAGDAFHGGYLFALKEQMEMPERCQFASAVAALVCRSLGGRAGAPTREEVSHFLEQHRNDNRTEK